MTTICDPGPFIPPPHRLHRVSRRGSQAVRRDNFRHERDRLAPAMTGRSRFFSKADVERDRPPASSHWLGILKFRARRAALWGYRSLTCRSPRSVPGHNPPFKVATQFRLGTHHPSRLNGRITASKLKPTLPRLGHKQPLTMPSTCAFERPVLPEYETRADAASVTYSQVTESLTLCYFTNTVPANKRDWEAQKSLDRATTPPVSIGV